MKSKLFFWSLVCVVFGGWIACGFLFFGTIPTAFYVIEGMCLCVALLFFILYRRLLKPYRILLNATELINEQDFSTRLRPVNDKDANRLIEIFNRMITHLKNERLQVREKNQFLDLLIKASPQGLVILDFDDRITEINPAGLQLLDITDITKVIGHPLGETGSELLQSLAAQHLAGNVVIRCQGLKTYRCICSSFVNQGFDQPFILIEELTQELLRIEKESYENIIRMMSHEVNNSVAAIGATLNVVSDILKQESDDQWNDVLPAVDASFDRCGRLANFISNLAHIVKIPQPKLSDVKLNKLACAVDALTRLECKRRNITLTLGLSDEDRVVRVDGIQFEQVLVNIVKNAYESIGENGEIRITTCSCPLSITIADNGPGISESQKHKLFTPFFTTKSTGQGIGLLFIREVLLNHACPFRLATEEGWTRFEIHFE